MNEIPFSAQIILGMITVIGAGVSAWVGVRVAIAEAKKEIEWIKGQVSELKADVRRLEERIWGGRK